MVDCLTSGEKALDKDNALSYVSALPGVQDRQVAEKPERTAVERRPGDVERREVTTGSADRGTGDRRCGELTTCALKPAPASRTGVRGNRYRVVV